MRRRALLTTIWAGLLAGCSTEEETTRPQTTETTYGYGGATAATETAVETGDAVATGTTVSATSATATKTASENDEYGEQRYGTLEYGG